VLLAVICLAWALLPAGSRETGDKGKQEQDKGKTDKGKKDPDPSGKKLDDKVKEIAGSAEFLAGVPKHFATLKAVDPARRQVTLLIEGEVLPKVWPLAADAEVKFMSWWGRLEDFTIGDRVWVWFKTDRKKQAVAISMIADEISQQDMNGTPWTVEKFEGPKALTLKSTKEKKPVTRTFKLEARPRWGPEKPYMELAKGANVYAQSNGDKVFVLKAADLEVARKKQLESQRARWTKEGLPGTVGFVHVFSGELDVILDHETMRWARSLQVADAVTIPAEPPIKALVKHVQPWRERTQLRLVIRSFELADLLPGQRIHVVRPAPALEVDTAVLPPDIDRPRASKQERIEWFLASIYCTCGVRGDRCTGHFYTLASCNPNGCGMPKQMRGVLAKKIDKGLTDRQIFEELLKEQGPELVRPHLLP
jgi:hypothetical protein